MLTLEAEPRKLGLKKQGEGERKTAAERPLPVVRLTGWYDGSVELVSSKLLLWLLSLFKDRPSSSSEEEENSNSHNSSWKIITLVLNKFHYSCQTASVIDQLCFMWKTRNSPILLSVS